MKVQEVKTFYICPDNAAYQGRLLHMEGLLKDMGFTDVTHKKTAGCGANVDLIDATVEILESVADDTPVLILEDDVNVNVNVNMGCCPDPSHQHRMSTDIYIPHAADAMYLGISRAGGSFYNGYDDGPCIVEPYNVDMVRVKNMLSAHAILYLSARYKADVVKRLKGIRGLANYYSDVVLSRLHPYYNIYAYKRPLFYQWAALGGKEADTRFVLE